MILKIKLRFCKTLNYVFENHFFKSHILNSLFLKSQTQTDPKLYENFTKNKDSLREIIDLPFSFSQTADFGVPKMAIDPPKSTTKRALKSQSPSPSYTVGCTDQADSHQERPRVDGPDEGHPKVK